MRESEAFPRGVRGRVLIADRDRAVVRLAERALSEEGYECEACESASALFSALASRGADVVLADLTAHGADLPGEIGRRYPEVAVVVLTVNPGVGSAIAAMREGAFDYLVKPLDPDELRAIVGRAVETRRLKNENEQLRRQLAMADSAAAFVAESPAGKQLMALIRRVAPSDATVLIEGESGTGKHLVAQMLHHWSRRSGGPFVTISYKGAGAAGEAEPAAGRRPSPPGEALSSELKRALDGTLFIDEVAEASPALQVEMLRVLDEMESASGSGTGKHQVRMVAGTSRPLKGEADTGRFREDLYFRLSAVPIRIPPLRERREDIAALARRFLAAYAAKTGRRLSLTSDAERELLAYRWPGNVRELRNVIERAAMLTGADFVPSKSLDLGPRHETEPPERSNASRSDGRMGPSEASTLPKSGESSSPGSSDVQGREATTSAGSVGDSSASADPLPPENRTLQECLDQAARARIKAALEAAGGNRADAAKALDIDGPTLGRLIRRLGL